MKVHQILDKTKKVLIECGCGCRFFWPMVRTKVKCPKCNTRSHSRWLYARPKRKGPVTPA